MKRLFFLLPVLLTILTVPASALTYVDSQTTIRYCCHDDGTADAGEGSFDFFLEPVPDGPSLQLIDYFSSGTQDLCGDISFLEHFTLYGIEYTVTSIGLGGFACTRINSVTIPETVTRINDGAFWYSHITEVTLSPSVTTICKNSFSYTRITSITLPASVTYIGNDAFNCPRLTEVVSYIEEPFPTSGFDAVKSQATLRVPAGTREKYLAAGWNFAEIVEMDGGEEPQGLTAEEEQRLTVCSNGFAFNLFGKAREGSSMVLSPLSVTYALSLLNNGADGQTRQEISSTLGFGDAGMDAVNAFCRKMLTRSGQLDSLTQVETASAVFVNRPFTLLPAFRQTAEQYYDAAAESLDFADSQSLGIINQWADDHTHGMIPRVLGMLDPGIVSYLLNAVYFMGTWTQKFDPAETRREPFGGKGDKVWMMHLQDNMYYDENETFQVLQLPYGNRSYTMTVLLPREGKDIADVLGQIDGRQWQRSFSIRREMVDVKLPRMDVTSDVQLDGVLRSLGMQRAFDQWAAEFPYFCDTETYVGRVSQKARLKLDEEGTEASAVTVVTTPPGDEEHTPQTYEFHADRPFLYVISEQATGAVYFIGQYMGKTSSPGPEGDLVTPSTHWQFKDAEQGNASEQIAVFNDRKQEAVLKQEAVAPGYGLQGRRLSGTPQRGLYIREGRKVIK